MHPRIAARAHSKGTQVVGYKGVCNFGVKKHVTVRFPPSLATCAAQKRRSVDRMDLLCGNDPSAGSPTETLLRLLLPLDDKV